MANLTEVAQWGAEEDGIYQLELNDYITGGEDGNDNVPHRLLANRTRFLKAKVDMLNDVGARYVEDSTGVSIVYLDALTKSCNAHFTGAYPADGIITCDWALQSGLTAPDPVDPTKSKWFAIATLNNNPVDNAVVKVDGSFYSGEPGYYETPLAYTNNVSHTRIQVVVLRTYAQEVDPFPVIDGAPNPYADVHAYVSDKVSQIMFNHKNTDTGEDIVALSMFDQWNKSVRYHAVKTVEFPSNQWMSRISWQPAILYARFVNESAYGTTSLAQNRDNPSYTPEAMTPQPILTHHYAGIKNVTGIYNYKKILKKVGEIPVIDPNSGTTTTNTESSVISDAEIEAQLESLG